MFPTFYGEKVFNFIILMVRIYCVFSGSRCPLSLPPWPLTTFFCLALTPSPL